MLKRARWSAIILCLTGVFCSQARADTLTLQLSELAEYARSKGVRAEVLSQQLELVKTQRDQALRWSNPEIAVDRESVESAQENQFTVRKSFEAPWSYLKKRSSWKLRIDAAQLNHENETRRLLAELKSGYVSLALLDSQLDRLRRLEELIPEVSGIVASRRDEGHLSGVDEHLIQMTLISLHAAHQSAIQSRREVETEWRSLMGVGPETTIVFETKVSFQDVDVSSAGNYGIEIETNPGYESRRLTEDAFQASAAAARGRFIPSITLYGGYKEIDPNHSGYVAGVSLGIPLFSRNGSVVKQEEIHSRIASREAEAYRIRLATMIEGLIQSINSSKDALSLFTVDGGNGETMTVALLQSYEEGWISLHELLNAIQIEVTGLGDFYSQTRGYYRDLFELEAITGRTLVEIGL